MKKSVHITDASLQYMQARADEINYSAAINAAFEQLAHLARAEMPDLSAAEFAEVCNVYAGSDMTRVVLPLNLAADILTHYGATIPSQIPAEAASLVERLAHMTQAQQFALADAVRVFWASADA